MDADPAFSEAVAGLPLGRLRGALAGVDSYLVGGVVRELVSGREPRGDLDVAVDAELEPLLEGLAEDPEIEVEGLHLRFGTAIVRVGGARVDLARTRRESYPRPGALPEVAPASIGADLARRDFTVNALALPLRPPHELLDPFGGAEDVRGRILRVLHERSFVDDPTRAIRAARYAARLHLAPDRETLELLRATDLATVSADRLGAEMARLAKEPRAAEGFALLADWGLLPLSCSALELIAAVERAAANPPWSGNLAARGSAILLAVEGGDRAAATLELAGTTPARASEAVRLASGRDPAQLLLAAAAGCEWASDYVTKWRGVALEIDGSDLIGAGIPEGPAVGAGLRAALERKRDGALAPGREAELAVALEVARRSV